jgi:hypothetical protein
MPTAFLWQAVSEPGPITREESAPWTGRQVAAADRLVAVKGNMFTGPDGFYGLFRTFQGDQPGSTSGFRTEVYIYDGKGTTPVGQTFSHGLGFVIRSAPTDIGMNVHQQFGASGKTPALHLFIDGDRFIARVNSAAGSPAKPIATRAEVMGKRVRVAYTMRPSNGADGLLVMELSIDGEPWRKVFEHKGPVGWGINPYPKGFIYGGSAGRTGFPWTVEGHGYFDKYPSLDAVKEAMALHVEVPGEETPPPPPPPPDPVPPPSNDPCAAIKAELSAKDTELAAALIGKGFAESERDAALARLAAIRSDVASETQRHGAAIAQALED